MATDDSILTVSITDKPRAPFLLRMLCIQWKMENRVTRTRSLFCCIRCVCGCFASLQLSQVQFAHDFSLFSQLNESRIGKVWFLYALCCYLCYIKPVFSLVLVKSHFLFSYLFASIDLMLLNETLHLHTLYS